MSQDPAPAALPASQAFSLRDPMDAAACAVVAALALLFLVTPLPPITDLPQQLAQMAAFREAFAAPGSPYVIHWAHPNALFYGLLILLGTVLPPLAAGKSLYFLLGAAQTLLLRRWARRLDSPPPAFLAAGLLGLNVCFYWGFGPFLLGGCCFLLWMEGLVDAPGRPRGPLPWILLALALYGSHLFWLAFTLGLTTAWGLLRRGTPEGRAALRALGLGAPILVAALVWVFQGFHPGANNTAPYDGWGWTRLDPRRWMLTFLGGIRGPWEAPLAYGVLAWTAWGLARLRSAGPRLSAAARLLLLSSAVAFLLFIVLPSTLPETAGVSDRWLPWAFQGALLALPAGTREVPARRILFGLAAVTGAFLVAGTALQWTRFNRVDLAGFTEVLGAVPRGSRLLYLDFQRRSPHVRNQPFMQLGAWAQVERQALPNTTFADLATTFVAFRTPRSFNRALLWNPAALRAEDLPLHDVALMHGPASTRKEIAVDLDLKLMREASDWGLYRINPTARTWD